VILPSSSTQPCEASCSFERLISLDQPHALSRFPRKISYPVCVDVFDGSLFTTWVQMQGMGYGECSLGSPNASPLPSSFSTGFVIINVCVWVCGRGCCVRADGWAGSGSCGCDSYSSDWSLIPPSPTPMNRFTAAWYMAAVYCNSNFNASLWQSRISDLVGERYALSLHTAIW
jgi:hypothetical protein